MSKVFTSIESVEQRFPKAPIRRHKLATPSLTGLRPVKVSSGRRSGVPRQATTGLVDLHGKPLSSEAFEFDANGTNRTAASDGLRREANFCDIGGGLGGFGGNTGLGSIDSYESAQRDFYDFRSTLTFAQLPPQDQWKELNFLRRFMYLHDEIIGPGIDLIAEIPWGEASIITDDDSIRKIYEDANDAAGLLEFMPRMTQHFLIHGEVIPWQWWDDSKGYWSYLYSLDPNDIHVASMPYSHAGEVLTLEPSTFIKLIASSNDPAYREIQRQMPPFLLKALRQGNPVILDPENTSYIVRENFPLYEEYTHEIRGQSILDRLFRIWILYEKIMEAEIAIADNFIYPVNIVKLGDDEWKPTQEEMAAVAGMFEEAKYDVRPVIVYHNAIELDRLEYSGSFTDLTDRFERMDDLKLIALGIAKDFLFGESTLASSRTEQQVFMMRLTTLKARLENEWLYKKYMDPIAEKNEMWDISTAQRKHNVRVRNYRKVWFRDPENPRSGKLYSDKKEIKQLATPHLKWRTQLYSVTDSDYADQLKDLYELGLNPDEGILSPTTLLQQVGEMDLEDEIRRKKDDLDLINKIMNGEEESKEEEESVSRRFELEDNRIVSKFIKRARQFFGVEDSSNRATAEDITAINKFFTSQENILYREGMRDSQIGKGEAPHNLFAGRSRLSSKRIGNLADAVIVPGVVQESDHASSKFWASLEKEETFSQPLKEHLRISESLIDDITERFLENEDTFIDDWITAFEEEAPEFIEFIYHSGKQKAYSGQAFEKRKQAGLIDSEYLQRKYAATISNFEDADIIESLRTDFFDSIKSLDKETVGQMQELLQDEIIDGHPTKATENIMKKMTSGGNAEQKRELRRKNTYKVQRAMRSVFANVYNLAILNGLIEQGFSKFRWLANKDACPTCRKMHKKTFSIDSFLKKNQNEWVRHSHPNCLCTAEGSGKRNASKDLADLHQALGNKGFSSYKIVADAATDPEAIKSLGETAKKIAKKAETVKIGNTLLISEWTKNKALAYIHALANSSFQKSIVKELQDRPQIQFPAFKANHLKFLTSTGVLEDDGQRLWFSSEFLSIPEKERTGSEIIDNMLEARKYAVQWSKKGDPIHTAYGPYDFEPDNPRTSWNRLVEAYFTDPNDLHKHNPLAWRICHNHFGHSRKYKSQWFYLDD